ncbi:PREDICTED: mediator of RNA polymerase II transcription subunit 27 isoform X2 [Tarenaya hassleriana]|uniref:mediator of RNA polymerase II transcription subunit 27 isoform X1 n=1 Tax=Tarenaya hassleriana TaxID=28532 RepID=UPI00053C11CD|nr:PREDICTED: mediator of RNA polymerase II transcription subunit 27 isoform X1 [Tarenaya hassleriana]XP_010543830.1 PREDICTED: mediator of RNA polymerase II transcription subunit 27 isoform X2 [Tarenaya hassleriana]
MQQLQPSPLLPQQSPETATNQPDSAGGAAEAPPKQVARAMERLNQAARVIADIRLGADRLLEAMFIAAQPHQSDKPLQIFFKEDASIRQHLRDLRSIGKKLEESGVLTESLRSRSNSWGLHMPLVCPDGAVVAYAWKRQLAGQAGASAVDRTRLALKAFTDQKRRFFPHLDDGLKVEPASKKLCASKLLPEHGPDELSECKTLSDMQSRLEKLVPDMKVSTYGRLNWLERANSLPVSASEDSTEASKPIFQSSSKLRSGFQQTEVDDDKVAVIELYFPSVFRAVVSVNPAGSVDPDAVAFFSPDEGGSYIHARGFSVHHVFRRITEHASTALQYFLGLDNETALYSLLQWICSYETLFSKPCSKCGKLLAMDKKSALVLPPVHRVYRELPTVVTKTREQNLDMEAYHVGCFPDCS